MRVDIALCTLTACQKGVPQAILISAYAGFMRDYASILPTASHAYNFQANAYNFTNNTVMANNLASQADVAVDPTLQVSRRFAHRQS